MLTPEEGRRAATWNAEIAAVLLGTEVGFTDIGHDRRWTGLGGFSVDRRNGQWYCFGSGEGGFSAVSLVRFLRQGRPGSWQEAEQWVRAWLTQHPGEGSATGIVPENEHNEAAAAFARRILETAPLLEEGDGLTYLQSRGLEPPYPLELRWLADARTGEGALVAPLVASGRAVGVLLTFVDARGGKSVVQPSRMRLNLEPDQPGAVIVIADAVPGVIDMSADTIITEGLENGLSLARVKSLSRILALPGIGALPSVPVRKGERVIVFQDSDDPDSPAAKGLQTGIDILLLAGARVSRTAHSDLGDANTILQAEGKGAAEVNRLIGTAELAPLSFSGEVHRLAAMPPTEYERARRQVAKDHKVRTTHLDKEVAKIRPRSTEGAEKSPAGALDTPPDPPWAGPIPELANTLALAVAEMPRYLIAPDYYYDVIATWAAATHLVHRDDLLIPVMPQLSPQAAAEDSGKTIALEIVVTLVRRGSLRSSYSSATLFRRIHAEGITPVLDEVHHRLPQDPGLQQIFNACHRKAAAFVDRTESLPSGERVVVSFKCWAALAWACIGEAPPETQSRAIMLPMFGALPEESARLLHSSPTISETLIRARRQLAAWANTIKGLPQVATPGLANRRADLWRVLLQVATLAGEGWPERIAVAIEENSKVERKASLTLRLLASIYEAFGEGATPNTFLPTEAEGSDNLLERLLNDTEAGWGEINRSRPITAYWLREHLRGLLEPPGSQQEPTGARRRGYYRYQFGEAFRRHLHTHMHVGASVPSAPSELIDEKPTPAATPEGTDADRMPEQSVPASVRQKPRAAAAPDDSRADGTDRTVVPDTHIRVHVSSEASSPNGVDLTEIDPEVRSLILEFRAAHPGRSPDWVAKQLAIKRRVVRTVFAEVRT